MTAQTTTYGREDWQALILLLLKVRYPAGDFVEVPDKVHGDCGIEGFSRDGKCFQCYAPDEPLTVAARTEKLKSKISADTAKLKMYAEKLGGILGPTKLKRWVLITPKWDDKSVLAHAEKKAAELRAAGLPFIEPDFSISIETLENYSKENAIVARAGSHQLQLHGAIATQTECDDWSTSHDKLVENLDRKARAIHGNDQRKVQDLRNRFIRHYLTGQNTLERMRDQQPDLYESAVQIKAEREEFLATESLIPHALPSSILMQAIQTFRGRLGQEMPGLSVRTVDQLVFEAISDWLLRCPLDLEAPQ